jgi:sugar transferase (PEP-CTERM/EpsH1 system associated)
MDVSLGGVRVYSDERVKVGATLDLELLLPGEPGIGFLARVMRVDALPEGGPARFDVALEFLHLSREAQTRLAARMAGECEGTSNSQARIHEQERDQVHGIDHEQGQQRLPQASSGAPVSRGPNGQSDVRDEDREDEELLHRGPPLSEARSGSARKATNGGHRRLSVLFVTPYLPSPPRFGGQMRLHGLISSLARCHDVSVLSLVDPSEDQHDAQRETARYCRRVIAVPHPRYAGGTASKRLLQLGSMFSSHSYEWFIHRQRALELELDAALARDRFDVVCFEFSHMAALRTRRGDRGNGGPVFVLDEHNIEYELVRQTARSDASGPVRRAYSALDWRKVRAEERRVWAGLDGCTLTSERDRGALLADCPGARTTVIPNGVDSEFFAPHEPPVPPVADTLLFFGAIDYYPNTDGLRFFLDDVLPLLDSRVPRVQLSIVGRRPPEEILARRGPTVQVTGAVDDVRPYLERAAVVICPLRLGSGTRLKILEAMAMGKAVVSTTLGAEGLDVIAGHHLLIADDAESFAAQIRRLLDSPDLAARIGAAARKRVVTLYSWRSSAERLSDFYGELIEARQAS